MNNMNQLNFASNLSTLKIDTNMQTNNEAYSSKLNTAYAVVVKNLTCTYKNKSVLEGVSFNVPKGSFTAILGENGAGKSTILKYLIKEKICKNGHIFINGKEINSYSQIELACTLSLHNQMSSCAGDLTVEELVTLGYYPHLVTGASKMYKSSEIASSTPNMLTQTKNPNTARQTPNLTASIIEKLALTPLKNKKISGISGGEFQRAMFARTLVQNTPIILLDEPFNNLDPRHVMQIINILKEETKLEKTIICVAHSIGIIKKYADYAILFKDGKVLSQGSVGSVLTEENIIKLYGTNLISD